MRMTGYLTRDEHSDNTRPPLYDGPAMSLSDALADVYDWFMDATGLLDGEEINHGLCREFADAVAERVPSARHAWGDGHVWIEYDGLCYDAECFNGVESPDDLPFFQRLH